MVSQRIVLETSLTFVPGAHLRGMSTLVYGSETLVRTDMPKSAGLRRADTIGGQVLDGWRARRQMVNLSPCRWSLDGIDI
jgi:hypothetical protein